MQLTIDLALEGGGSKGIALNAAIAELLRRGHIIRRGLRGVADAHAGGEAARSALAQGVGPLRGRAALVGFGVLEDFTFHQQPLAVEPHPSPGHDADMSAQVRPRMSYPEYLLFEAASLVKHEYLRGEVWAMAGGTPTHSVIAANVARHLGNALAGRPCAVFNSDLRVRVTATDRSTYPDVTVVCGKRELASDDAQAITNPILIVEVLSESTEASDRGEKFAHLQRLSALAEYVLVSQDSRRVEVFTRTGGDTWKYAAWGEGAQVPLESLGVALDVESLYADPTG